MMRISGLVLLSVLALLAAPCAYAGTATFAGTANDTEEQLEGGWVSYKADGIACSLGDAQKAATTNVTSLCGTRSLSDLGTITLITKDHNDFWGDWYGAWLEVDLSVGADAKVGFGFGPEWDWWSASCPVYIFFGDQDESTRPQWRLADLGVMPVGVRLASDGTNITLSWSGDGATFTALQSWPINNLPGGLGDMTSTALSCEIGATCTTPEICKFQWTAETVPTINGAGGDCAYEAAEGEGEGEGEEGEGEGEGECEQLGTLMGHFVTESIFSQAAAAGTENAADSNSNGIPDNYEVALLAAAMCENEAIVAAFNANVAIGDTWNAGNDPAWGHGSYEEVAAAFATMGSEGMTSVNWVLWIFADGYAPFTAGGKEVLSGNGDYDGDGFTNREEYESVMFGSLADYVEAAMTPATSCADVKRAMLFNYFYAEGVFSPTADEADSNGNNIPDDWEVALLAVAMCEYPSAQAAFDANVAVADTWNEGNDPKWGHGYYEEVAAAFATMGSEGMTSVNWVLWIFADGFAAWDTGSKTATEPLSGTGDYDGDDLTNADEAALVTEADGDALLYVQAATDPTNFWPGNPELPVAGLIGLGLLAVSCAAGGAMALRRKK